MRLRAFGILTLALGVSVPAVAQEKLPPASKFGAPKTTAPTSGAPATGAPSSGAPRTGTTGAAGTTPKSSGAPAGSGTLRPPTGNGAGTTGAGAGGTTTGTRPATTGAAGAGATGAAGGATSNTRDLASYAIGLDIAARFASDGMQVNPEMILQGLKDGFAGGKPRYPEDKLRTAAEAFEREVQALAQQRFKEIAAKNKEDGAVFLAENKKKKTVKALASGLQYEVVKTGAGKSPKSTDKVRAHYHGTLVDGTVFDTTQNEQPIDIDVQGAIPGWTEALQLMKSGDKWRLYVPPELAYGAEGFGPVPPNAVLIFELELVEVLTPAAQNSARPATINVPVKK